MDPDVLKRVIALARAVQRDEAHIGVLSTGERCAVALLHGRADFLPSGYTYLDAVDRLAGDWLKACVKANRDGWRE
jgi:hypothetical protein